MCQLENYTGRNRSRKARYEHALIGEYVLQSSGHRVYTLATVDDEEESCIDTVTDRWVKKGSVLQGSGHKLSFSFLLSSSKHRVE